MPVPVSPRTFHPHEAILASPEKHNLTNLTNLVPGKSAPTPSPTSPAQTYGPSSSRTTCRTCTTRSRTGPGAPATAPSTLRTANASASTTPRISSMRPATTPTTAPRSCTTSVARCLLRPAGPFSPGPSPRPRIPSLLPGMTARLSRARVSTALLRRTRTRSQRRRPTMPLQVLSPLVLLRSWVVLVS